MTGELAFPFQSFVGPNDPKHQFNNLTLLNWAKRTQFALVYRVTFLSVGSAVSWAVPASETEWGTGYRQKVSLLGAPYEYRIVRTITSAAAAGAKLRVKWYNGSSWVDLAETAGAGDCLVDATYEAAGTWASISPAAMHDDSRSLSIFGLGGNGSTAAQLTQVAVEFRL